MKVMEEEIQPILVPAVLEHEGISGVSAHVDPKEALDKLLRILTSFHSTFIKHGLDSEIISQLFRQLFYFICAVAVNNLLLRKEMCHWSRGMKIRYVGSMLWHKKILIHQQDLPWFQV